MSAPRWLLLASLLGLLVLAPASSAGSAHPAGPKKKQPKVLVAKKAQMTSRYWVRLRVRCVAPRGFTCEGNAWLLHTRARIAGTPLPVAGPRRYRLGAGKRRTIALRLVSYARPSHPPRHAGAVWVKAWVYADFADDAEPHVRMHWKGPRGGR